MCEGQGHGLKQRGEAYAVDRPVWFAPVPHTRRPAAKTGSPKLGEHGLMEQCRRCSAVFLDASDGTALWWADRCETVLLAEADTRPPGSAERAMLVSAADLPDDSPPEDPSADWHQAARDDVFHFLITTWMSDYDIRCGWCGQRRSDSVTFLPPLSWCDSYHDWKIFGGHLMPSCGPCYAKRAEDDEWTPTGLRPRKTARNLQRARLTIQQIAGQISQQLEQAKWQ